MPEAFQVFVKSQCIRLFAFHKFFSCKNMQRNSWDVLPSLAKNSIPCKTFCSINKRCHKNFKQILHGLCKSNGLDRLRSSRWINKKLSKKLSTKSGEVSSFCAPFCMSSPVGSTNSTHCPAGQAATSNPVGSTHCPTGQAGASFLDLRVVPLATTVLVSENLWRVLDPSQNLTCEHSQLHP